MRTIQVRVIHTRYSVLTGLAWLLFWGMLLYFAGVLAQLWTQESVAAPFWWVASALRITCGRPYREITIRDMALPVKETPPTE